LVVCITEFQLLQSPSGTPSTERERVMQTIEEFVAERGIEPSARLLGLTGQYIGRVVKENRAIVVIPHGKSYRALEVTPFGSKHNTPKARQNEARKYAQVLIKALQEDAA
jgi:hypothetical protein